MKTFSNEVKLKVIEITGEERGALQYYYYQGGSEVPFGKFKGCISKIQNNKVLFKKLYIEFDERDGTIIEDKEEHIWLLDIQPIIDKNLKEKDNISFNALVYAYKRKNGTIDYSLKCLENIIKIKDYELPSDEYLMKQSLDNLKCEICPYSEQCYRTFCMFDI